MTKSIKDQIQEQMINRDETPNYLIEDLYHGLEVTSSMVYQNWTIWGNAWTSISVSDSNSNKSVDVVKSETHVGKVVVYLWTKKELFFSMKLDAKDNVIPLIIMPMIQQFLAGDREEVKGALSPLLKVSPAIN